MDTSTHPYEEKKMFGGAGFLVCGTMSVGVIGDDICVRVCPGRDETALEQPHVGPLDFTWRPMSGWIYVVPVGPKKMTL